MVFYKNVKFTLAARYQSDQILHTRVEPVQHMLPFDGLFTE